MNCGKAAGWGKLLRGIGVVWFGLALFLARGCGEGPGQKGSPPGAQQNKLQMEQVPGLRDAWVRSQQSLGVEDPAYQFMVDGTDLVARHQAQGYTARLSGDGLRVQVGSAHLHLGAGKVRCGELAADGKPERASERNRASISRGGFREWFGNGPLGLEHGLDFAKAPQGCDRNEPLRVEFAVTGMQARTQGKEVGFFGTYGQRVLRYTDLSITDGEGQRVQGQLVGEEDKLVIEVVWDKAVFPLHIDPLIWVEQQELLASDRATNDVFGISVALSADGNTALIGAYNKSDSLPTATTQNGAAYVFVRSGTSWTQQQKLLASDKATNDWFGYSVALSADGNTALIGANNKSDNGAAYVFVRSGTSWTQQQKLLASDKASGDSFGISVELSADGNTALVGAPGKSDSLPTATTQNGVVYVFVRSGTSWTQQQKLLASDKASGDNFGISVAVSADGNTALAGAHHSHGGIGSGTAYAFVLSPPKSNGAACVQGSECASGYCADGVCCNSACGGGVTADCQACSKTAGAAVDGTCGTASASTVCRSAGGVCDLAENCNGTQPTCPADAKKANTVVCRNATGICDAAETCDGVTNNCPADVLHAPGTVCRISAGACDLEETCNGTSPACPVDARKPTSTVCRSAQSVCDVAESCDGTSVTCPPDLVNTNTATVCRSAGGACDLEETCDGTNPACPVDARKPASTVCRSAQSVCDVAESCDGTSVTCPPDLVGTCDGTTDTGCSCNLASGGSTSGAWISFFFVSFALLAQKRRRTTRPKPNPAQSIESDMR